MVQGHSLESVFKEKYLSNIVTVLINSVLVIITELHVKLAWLKQEFVVQILHRAQG